MTTSKKILANFAKAAAERALRRDANSTTCISFYQPKAPGKLTQFKVKSNAHIASWPHHHKAVYRIGY